MEPIRLTMLLATAVALFSGFGCGPMEEDADSFLNDQVVDAKINHVNLPANQRNNSLDIPADLTQDLSNTRMRDTDGDRYTVPVTTGRRDINPAVVPPAPNPINYSGASPVYGDGLIGGGVIGGMGGCCCPLIPERLVANPCTGYCTNVRCYDAENFMVNPYFYERLYRSLPWYRGTTILNPGVGCEGAVATGCPSVAPVASTCPTRGCPL